jgi:hypothetical protein
MYNDDMLYLCWDTWSSHRTLASPGEVRIFQYVHHVERAAQVILQNDVHHLTQYPSEYFSNMKTYMNNKWHTSQNTLSIGVFWLIAIVWIPSLLRSNACKKFENIPFIYDRLTHMQVLKTFQGWYCDCTGSWICDQWQYESESFSTASSRRKNNIPPFEHRYHSTQLPWM